MFYLSEIQHTLQLPPCRLDRPLHVGVKEELEGLFLDKVIANLGLCISVYDVKSIDGGFICPGDGASTYTVLFRLIMFRPFAGEVIVAKLKESNADGLRLSLGFFEDIYVPSHLMPIPSEFKADPEENAAPEKEKPKRWIWQFGEENFAIDGIDEIRFRVQNVNYPSIPVDTSQDEKRSIPAEQGKAKQAIPAGQGKEKQSKPFAPMVVTGELDADGLGPISWWV